MAAKLSVMVISLDVEFLDATPLIIVRSLVQLITNV